MTEYLKHIFLYNSDNPFIFTKIGFWIFFAVILAVYSVLYKNRAVRNAYLFFASLFFYYKTSGLFLFILIFSTLTDFFIGKKIYKSQKPINKKLFLALSITINLLILTYFKYTNFFVDNINIILGTDFKPINIFADLTNILTGSHFEINKILLPVGISFYTFQTISYSIDIYRNKVKPVTNILDFGFYVSFFPQLVAGPIVRAAEFIPQLYQKYNLTKQEFGHALFLILNGLIKKIIIGDFIAVNFIDRVFSNPLSYSGFENIMSLYGYSLQVYADFSGYTDIAIGIALIMGFKLPLNFNSPYKARNVGEFWKRWHISLSSWLKDYLYIPMGGNRKGSVFTYISLIFLFLFVLILIGNLKITLIIIAIIISIVALAFIFPRFKKFVNTNINLMATMLLGGLWHGASWQFLTWGGLNGLGLVVYKLWKRISPWEGKNNILLRFWTIFLTFNFITFTRIWFRGKTPEVSKNMLIQIFTDTDYSKVPSIISNYWFVFLLMIIGFVIHWLPSNFKEYYRGWFIKSPMYVKLFITAEVIMLIYQFQTSELYPFIYFQF